MPGRASISEILEVLAKTYRAIDVRVAAVRDGDSWASGLTVVRLTYEEPTAAELRLRELGRRYTPVATKNFKILLGVRPFSEWESFCTDCKAAIVRMGDLEIQLRQPIKVSELTSEIRFDPWGLRPVDGISWPGVFASVGTSDPRLGQEALVKEVGPLGYSFPLEAVNELCEVNVTHGQNPGSEFYVAAPVFARIESVRLVQFKKQLEVKVRKHSDISSLSGTIVLRGQNFGMTESSRYRKVLPDFEVLEESPLIQTLSASASGLPDIPLETWVEVKLVHSKLGEIQQIMQSARSLIPPTERNVLFEALKHFCPVATLDQLVVSPHSRKSVTFKTSAAFEVHVAWLLGLCGLSTIVLGEYEHLIAPETNIPRGSVDILASRAHRDTLFLVACTLGPPKEEDFGNILNVRGILEREVFNETSIRVLPVVFTGAHGQPPSRAIENELVGIPIMDADRIQILLSLISQGSEGRFFDFLANPRIFHLQ